MNGLQLVEYSLCEVLSHWKQIGDKLGEEVAMLVPKVIYESDQPERASERADSCGRRTLTLHVSPVNPNAHVIVAPGIPGMRQAVASMSISPVPLIPISGTQLLQILAGIRHQELLRVVGDGKDISIFPSHQLRVELIILVSAFLSIQILNVQSVGSGNAFTKKGVRFISGLE